MTKRLASVLSLVLFAECQAVAPPTQYYASDASGAMYVAWTEDATGHIQGQVQVVSVDSNDPTKLKSTNAAFTGTRNGSDISIVFSTLSAYSGATWTGTLAWGSLSLVIPTAGFPNRVTLQAGSFDDFQHAAQALQSAVASAQQQQAAAQAAAAQRQAAFDSLTEASNDLSSAYTEARTSLATLRQLLPAAPTQRSIRAMYAVEWTRMQQVWTKEIAAAQVQPMTCYQKGQVMYIAGQVGYELGQVSYLDGQARYVLQQVQTAMNSANDGVAGIENWAPAYYQRLRVYDQLTGQQASISDPTAAAQAFAETSRNSLSVYSRRIASFEHVMADYDAKARALDQRARAYPNTITCSG